MRVWICGVLMAVMLAACSPAASTTPLSSPIPDTAATETAIAASVAGLFGATQVAISNPSPTPLATTVPLSTPTLDPFQRPEAVAQMWFTAMMTGDGLTVGRLTCQAYQEDSSTVSGVMGIFPNMLNAMSGNLTAGATVQLDLSRVQFNVLAYGEETVVSLSGTMGIALGGFYRENTLTGAEDPLWMVYEDGMWKTCGFWTF